MSIFILTTLILSVEQMILTLAQVEDALLTGVILEQYPDTSRGESCLVVGFSRDIPVHAVCG
jgi:hypothetical protein